MYMQRTVPSRRKDVLAQATTWTDTEGVRLREIAEGQKDNTSRFHVCEVLREVKRPI